MNVAQLNPQDCRVLLELLTPREREVALARIVGGGCKAAARALRIELTTVEVHSSRILNKIGAQSFEQVAVVAVKAGAL